MRTVLTLLLYASVGAIYLLSAPLWVPVFVGYLVWECML